MRSSMADERLRLEFAAVDAATFDEIPDPALPGASCRACDYWETLDGSRAGRAAASAAAWKLQRLTASARLAGSYAMLAYRIDAAGGRTAVGYAQFGPISAYARAQAIRDRYPSLPESPPPYVVTCIQVRPETGEDRGAIAERLLRAVCEELDGRGVVAVEAYPEATAERWIASPGPAPIYEAAGFARAVDDERYPVYRIELAGSAGDVGWPAELLRQRNDDDAWPLPLPKTPDDDAWRLPQKPRVRNPFGEDE